MTKNNNTMKTALKIFGLFFLFSAVVSAQTSQSRFRTKELPILNISEEISLHIVSPEPIQFIDLSTDLLAGDMPTQNIARIKINKDSEDYQSYLKQMGIVTVVGQSFIAQYKIVKGDYSYSVTNIQIQPDEMQPIDDFDTKLSTTELRSLAKQILSIKNKKPIRKVKDFKMNINLNNAYVRDDYIFLDITFNNHTNLPYEIQNVIFEIDDKKIYKATNNQSLNIKPLFTYNNSTEFRKNYRNIYVFKKFTFPNSKNLIIRLTEKQISGRTVELKIKYKDILNADTI